jgi:hypothetical protein
MGIEGWIKAASDDQLRAKIEEYEASSRSWNGRDNEMICRLLASLRLEVAGRAKDERAA